MRSCSRVCQVAKMRVQRVPTRLWGEELIEWAKWIWFKTMYNIYIHKYNIHPQTQSFWAEFGQWKGRWLKPHKLSRQTLVMGSSLAKPFIRAHQHLQPLHAMSCSHPILSPQNATGPNRIVGRLLKVIDSEDLSILIDRECCCWQQTSVQLQWW